MTLVGSIPALPVLNALASAAFFAERFGFAIVHQVEGFAVVGRDGVEVHLWQSDDESWRSRDLTDGGAVRTGAESFIAGTGSCRIETDDVDALYAELTTKDVLHPTDRGSAITTEWLTREFATLDLDGNLLTFFRRIAHDGPAGLPAADAPL